MKATTFAKASAGLAAAATLSFALTTAANAATSAPTATQEDPTTSTAVGTLVGVGSDTIQDVEYGISQDLGLNAAGQPELASWTATGGTSITYRSGLTVARPNGSGAGYKALSDSIGLTNAGNANVGDVDYSRASGTQGTPASGSSGVSTDIPFAIDAIGAAVPANSPFLLTNGGQGLTITDLYDIYAGVDNEVNKTDGSLKAETTPGTVDSGYEAIQAFLPKPGSGSRQFFLGQISTQGTGINLTAGGASKGDGLFTQAGKPVDGTPYIGAEDASGNPVQEHDAQVLTDAPSDVAAIAPFSAAKFIGYHNGLIADPDTGKVAGTDYTLVPFDSTVAGHAGRVLPYTGDASSATSTLAPNPDYQAYAKQGTESASFALTREVYNIIPTAAWQNPNANVKYRTLYDMFVGKGSKFCLDSATIEKYGFMVDPNCGSTAKTYDAPSTSTVTETNTAAKAGGSTRVTFSVQSNGNGGGTINATIGGKAYTATIPAGHTSAVVTVPTPTAGTLAITGGFTPNLAGVAASPIPPGSKITVAKTTATVTASAPSVRHTTRAKVNVAVSAAGVKPTGAVTVTVKLGTKTEVTVANKAISATTGKVTVTLTKALPRGSYSVYVSYTGDKNVAAKASTKLTTLKVS